MTGFNEFLPDFDNDDAESPLGDSHPAQERRNAVSGGPVARNPFMPVFDSSEVDQERDRLGFSMREAAKVDPDRHGKVLDLSKRANIPAPVVDRNYEDVVNKTRITDFDLDGMADKSPATASFLSVPDNAKLAHDDVENLTAMESLLKYSTNALKRGVLRVEQGYNQFVAEESAEQSLDAGRSFSDILDSEKGLVKSIPNPIDLLMAGERFATSRLFGGADETAAGRLRNVGRLSERIAKTPMSPPASAARDAISAAGKRGLLPAIDAALSDPAGSLALAAEVGVEFAPQIAVGSLATVATRNPMAGASMMGGLSGLTERFSSPSEFLSKRGYDLTDPKTVEGILNDSGLMQAAAEHGYTRGMIIGSIDALSGGLASKTLFQGPLRNMLAQLGVQSTLGGTGEALAQQATDGEIDWGEVVMEALGEFATTPVEVIGVGGRYIGDKRKVRKAKEAQGLIDQGAALAKTSRLRERAPDAFKEHLEQAAPGATVFVSTDALSELFQSAPDAGSALAESIEGFEGRFSEAAAADGFVEIKVADYAAHIASLEEHDALIRENVKINFDDFTSNEALAFENDVNELVAAETDQLARTSEVEQTAAGAAQRAGDRVQEQLTRAGRSTSVAQDEAAAHRAFAKVLQERYGLAPDEVDGLYGNLAIKGQLPQSLRALPVDQLDLLLDRARTGSRRSDTQVLGESLLDFVRRLGIKDDRGDLRALDIDADLPPFTLRALREDGMSIDDVALAVQEAGYFPDLQLSEGERADINKLIDAIGQELTGNPLFQENGPDQNEIARREAAEDLARELDRRGIDIDDDNEAIKAALADQELDDGAELFQPDGAASSRGSIQFLPGDQVIINLGEAADLSTFLHESGHYFVRVLESVAPHSPEAQHDLDAMMAFVGAESAEQFAEVEKQETLARGFEAYLREGKAPSVELQSAFRRFKSWLVSVYRELLNLNVELTPEIRRTFDRMLATDDEISAAEGFNRYTVDHGLADLLTPTERQKLETAAQAASDTAKEELLKRKIAEQEREATATWKAERAKLLDEIGRDVDARPVYRAIDMLRNKEIGLKLSRAVVTDLLGDEVLSRLPRGLVGKDGIHPDVIADLVGITSGDALLLDLMNAAPNKTKRAEQVTQEADTRMTERHGSLSENRRQAAEAANEIVLSEDRAKFIAMEMRLLAEKAGDALSKAAARDVADQGAQGASDDRAAIQDAQERTAVHEGATDAIVNETFEKERAEASKIGRRAQQAATRQTRAALNVKPAVVREVARQIIARNKVNDAIKAGRYATASQREAKNAALAIARRDYPSAAEAKRKQLLNHYLALEATKAKTEVDAGREYLDKFSNRRRAFKGIDADHIDKIRTITTAYQVGPKLSNRRRVILELRAINDWIKEQETDAGALLNIPPEILAADEKTHYRDLSLDDFRALRDTVKNLEAQGRLKKKLLIGGEEKDLAEAVAEIVSGMDRLPPTGRARRRAMEQNPSGGDKVLGGLATADAALMKVEFILEALDGKRNGPFHKLLFQPFADAAARSADMTKETTKTVMDAIDGLPKKTRKRLHEKVTVPSMSRTFQRSDLIMMALNTGNESNLTKMIEGSAKDASPGAVAWTEQSVNEALENLTKEEFDLVQTIWDTFETMYPSVEAIHRREYGVAPERVEARTVSNKHGDYRGGYFPMAYDTARTSQARDIEAKTALEAMQSEAVKASVNSSMTKGRTGFSAPVMLRLDALPNHIARTVHFVTHYDAVRSSRKLLGNGEINKAITNKLGPEYFDALKDWIGAIATNGREEAATTPIGKVVEAMRTNATVAIMGLSYTTMAAQVLGYANSVDALARNDDGSYSPGRGTRWLLSGLVQYASHPGKIKALVFAKSGEMRHRFENTDRELRHSMKRLQGKKGTWKQMQRFSLMGIAGIQLYVVDFPVWLGAYNKAISEGMNDGDAVNRADSIVRTSQTAGGVKDLAAIQRKKGVTTALTMFYSYFNLLYNMERQAVSETKKARDIPRLAARVALLIAIPAAADELMRQNGPEDDEDPAEWVALKSAIYAMSSVPLLRDFVGLASGFGFSLSPIDGLGESLGRSVKAAAKAFDEDDENGLSASDMKALVTAFGFGVGAPATQINRVIDAADAADQGYDVGPYDFLTGYKDD